MDHEYIRYLRENHPTVKLLLLDNAPLIISFLHLKFKKQNKSSIPSGMLTTELADYIFHLRQQDEKLYSDSASNYLTKWTEQGFLRKYYTDNDDEPVFELTPATEKALDWIKDLDRKEFVGTESRLLQIFEILKEIAYKTTDEPQQRLMELERQKLEIELEIQRVKEGNIDRLNETKVRERFHYVVETARKLLNDFRQIEYNFRELDRAAREKQIDNSLKKGKLLEDVFKYQQDYIWDTDQGRSFKSFWEFLMSSQKQDELDGLLNAVISLPEVQSSMTDDFIERLKVNLVEAGERVNSTNHHLIEQLSKYLDSKTFLENKRIIDIINEIKSCALQVKETPPKDEHFAFLEMKPSIDLLMDRPLFRPSSHVEIDDSDIEHGVAAIDTTALYRQWHVDPMVLTDKIRELLKTNTQVTLKQVIEKYPIEKGLAEIITYFDIATKDNKAVINSNIADFIKVLNKETNISFEFKVPQIIFCR